MNQIKTPAARALGLAAVLFMVAAPVSAERYIVEPMVETIEVQGQSEQGFSQAELDQMLAPIALYPDVLLSQVLIASTYPLEIVEAARWSRRNPHLEGEEAVAAVADRDWDPSVKALVAFPELLEQLSEDLEWTRNLGDAMLFQEAQVMDSIQFLRARADAAGSLADTEYVRVVREEKTIIIEPARTHVIHVPYYDPWVVYGPWWRPAYPPVVWVRPAHYYYGYPGFYWSSGIHVSHGFFFSSFYWPQRHVYIVHTPRYYSPPRHRPARPYPYTHYTPGQRWKHNPLHRRGVAYRHPEVRERYWGSGTTPRYSGGSRSDGDRSGWNDRDRSHWAGTDRPRPSRSVQPPSADGEPPRAGGAPPGRQGVTVRPDASSVQRNLGSARVGTAPSRATTQPPLTPRATAPSTATPQASAPRAAAPRATTPSVSRPQSVPRPGTPARTPQASPPSAPVPSAAPAPAAPARATNRGSSRSDTESRAPSRARGDAGAASSRSMAGSRDARRSR